MNDNLVRLSKTISHALRHKPEEYGLTLDAEGWVALDDLLAALQRRRTTWRNVSQADIHTIMAESEKQRFELHNGKIRAFYGHSIADKIEKQPSTPPDTLYHGTTPQALVAIRREGLKSMKRQYVHLSTDERTARLVALRRTGQPVILCIAARQAHEHGIRFYPGNEDIWLAEPIPSEFILF
ncbi:MAG TPA: RNA 2'-phosphotransferase [Ktedonobacteraceae bacterium]|nr:RNA 2'-phosphotransferase [Ktedonobacteraceae bacterium]